TRKQEAEVCAKEIASWLDNQRVAGNYEGLVLVGSPQFLGLLRKSLPDHCKKMVQRSLDKNLVHASTDEIHQHIIN
ncbi:MAG: host attachment protein, partial [Pseudomonadales bacterium]|nr:host attachment protein [Pseudomonadales bacterium]